MEEKKKEGGQSSTSRSSFTRSIAWAANAWALAKSIAPLTADNTDGKGAQKWLDHFLVYSVCGGKHQHKEQVNQRHGDNALGASPVQDF